MTILLSNSNEQPLEGKKQIKIKSIDLLKVNKQDKVENENYHTHHELIEARNELKAVLEEKETLIQETKEKIEEERAQWEEEKQQWITDAKKQGYDAGITQGKEEGKMAYQQLLDEANHLTTAALKDYHATVEKSSETILELSIHTAKKIVENQIIENPNKFIEIVKAAIKEIKDQPIISIYLHPMNYQVVLQQKEELIQLLENEAKLSIYTKENIAEHSCLIEHPFGQIDASVDTQLGEIRSVLQNIVMEK